VILSNLIILTKKVSLEKFEIQVDGEQQERLRESQDSFSLQLLTCHTLLK
jgi:hypothetical protein